MILTSTTERVKFTPVWYEQNEPAAPRFYLRAASVLERHQLEAELTGEHRAGQVYSFDLKRTIREGVLKLLDGDPEQGHVLELLERDEKLGDDERATIDGVRRVLAEAWPDFRELMAQMARRDEIAPLIALKRFCVDIEAPSVTFARDKYGLVADSTLAGLNSLDLKAAGRRAYALAYPGLDAEKNSPRPSSPDDGLKSSANTADTSKADGKSRGTSGTKTRASRAQPGRSPSSISG